MATASDLFNKVDYEGDEGITWFKPEEFKDPGLSQRLKLALSSYEDFQHDFRELMDFVENLMDNEERNSTT